MLKKVASLEVAGLATPSQMEAVGCMLLRACEHSERRQETIHVSGM